MSANPEYPVPTSSDVCPLCEALVARSAARCPQCGFDLAGVGERPGAYSRQALWWTIAGFVAIYVVVLALVAATN